MSNESNIQKWLEEFFLHVTRGTEVTQAQISSFLDAFANVPAVQNNKEALVATIYKAANTANLSDPTKKAEEEASVTTGDTPTIAGPKDIGEAELKKLIQFFETQAKEIRGRAYEAGRNLYKDLPHYSESAGTGARVLAYDEFAESEKKWVDSEKVLDLLAQGENSDKAIRINEDLNVAVYMQRYVEELKQRLSTIAPPKKKETASNADLSLTNASPKSNGNADTNIFKGDKGREFFTALGSSQQALEKARSGIDESNKEEAAFVDFQLEVAKAANEYLGIGPVIDGQFDWLTEFFIFFARTKKNKTRAGKEFVKKFLRSIGFDDTNKELFNPLVKNLYNEFKARKDQVVSEAASTNEVTVDISDFDTSSLTNLVNIPEEVIASQNEVSLENLGVPSTPYQPAEQAAAPEQSSTESNQSSSAPKGKKSKSKESEKKPRIDYGGEYRLTRDQAIEEYFEWLKDRSEGIKNVELSFRNEWAEQRFDGIIKKWSNPIDTLSGMLAKRNPFFSDELLNKKSILDRELEIEANAVSNGDDYHPELLIPELRKEALDSHTITVVKKGSDGVVRNLRLPIWAFMQRNQIDPNTVPVNDFGFAPISIDFITNPVTGKRTLANAPFGDYDTEESRGARQAKDQFKTEADYAKLEQVARSRQLATPEYLTEKTNEIFNTNIQKHRAQAVLAAFGYDPTDNEDLRRRQLASTWYRLADIEDLSADAWIEKIREYEDIIQRHRAKGTVKGNILSAIDSVGKAVGLNFGFSRFAQPEGQPEEVSWIDIKNPNSEYNQEKKQNDSIISALEETIKSDKQRIDELQGKTDLSEEERKELAILSGDLKRVEKLHLLRKKMKESFFDKNLSPRGSIYDVAIKSYEKTISSLEEFMNYAGPNFEGGDASKGLSFDTSSLVGKKGKDVEKSMITGASKTITAIAGFATKLGRVAIPLAILTYAFQKVIGATVRLGEKFYSLSKEVEAVIEKAAPYSTLTSISARWFKGQEIQREYNEARALEASRALLASSWSELKDAFQPLVLAIKDLTNILLAAVGKFITDTVKENTVIAGGNPFGGMYNTIRDRLKAIPWWAAPLIPITVAPEVLPEYKPSGDSEDYSPENSWAYRKSREAIRKRDLREEIRSNDDIVESIRKSGQSVRQAEEEWFNSQATIEDAKIALKEKGVRKNIMGIAYSDKQIAEQLSEFIEDPKKLQAQRMNELKGIGTWYASPTMLNAMGSSSDYVRHLHDVAMAYGETFYELDTKANKNADVETIFKEHNVDVSDKDVKAIKNTREEEREEYLAYYMINTGKEDLTINGTTYKDTESMREAILDRLDTTTLRLLDLLTQFGKLDENAKDIVSILRQMSEEDPDKLKEIDNVIFQYLADGLKAVQGPGKKDWNGPFSKPWGYDPDKPLSGRWAGNPTVEQR